MTHGYGKFAGFNEYVTQFPSILPGGPEVNLSMAIFAELICAGLLVIGLFSRLALIPLIITMGVAFFMIHGADPFAKKELALLYLGMYVTLFITGPGAYSVQEVFRISAGRFTWWLK